MKVILLQDVRALGKAGQEVNVSDGYAANALLPKGLAVAATDRARNDMKLKKQHEAKVAAEKLAEAQELAKKLEGLKTVVKMKKGQGDKPFGSVTAKEIAEAVEKQHGITIDKKKIQLADPIRTFGMQEVPVRLHPSVTGRLYVLVEEI